MSYLLLATAGALVVHRECLRVWSCDLIFRESTRWWWWWKLSSIPFWKLSLISFDHHYFVLNGSLSHCSPYMDWWWLILYSVPRCLRPKKLIFLKQQSGRFVGFAEQDEWWWWFIRDDDHDDLVLGKNSQASLQFWGKIARHHLILLCLHTSGSSLPLFGRAGKNQFWLPSFVVDVASVDAPQFNPQLWNCMNLLLGFLYPVHISVSVIVCYFLCLWTNVRAFWGKDALKSWF